MTPEALKAIETARKLLETKGRTEEEAAIFAGKAMSILAKHNLTMANIKAEAKDTSFATRQDAKRKGGLYSWQRDLWEQVAKLNFCMYFSIKGTGKGQTYQHRMIGAEVNVVSAEMMAEYLQGAVERLAQEWAKANGYNVFARDAIAYREGMTDRLTARLRAIAHEREEEAAREARERETRARHPGSAPTAGTSLVLADVYASEADLNYDYIHGLTPGTTAKNRAERKAKQAAADAAYAEWEKNNPEEVAKKKAENEAWLAAYYKKLQARDKRAEKRGTVFRGRAMTEREKRAELGAHYEGYQKANDISLNKQIDEEATGEIE